MPLLMPAISWLTALVLTQKDSVSLSFTFTLIILSILVLFKWRTAPTWLFFLGMLIGTLHLLYDVKSMVVSPDWFDQKHAMTAVVEKVQAYPQYVKLRLAQVTRSTGEVLPCFAELYLYRHKQAIHEGDSIALEAKFHAPRNKLNPDSFDYVAYTFDNRVGAIGSASGEVTVLERNPSLLQSLRVKVQQSIAVAPVSSQGVLSALLLADRSQIPLAVSDAFAATGASHLLAISGLHVGMVAAWGFALMWWLMTRREAWVVRFSVRRVSLIAGFILAFCYALLAGWPIPAQRALLMLAAAVLAWNIRAHQVPLNTMLAALVFITLIDPSAVLSPSLWLSFVATAALLIWLQHNEGKKTTGHKFFNWMKGLVAVSVIAWLATLPLIVFLFERLPLWSVAANMVLVPLYSLYVLPLALLGEWAAVFGLSSVAELLMQWAGFGIDAGSEILIALQQWPLGDVWVRGDMAWLHMPMFTVFVGCGLFWLKEQRAMALSMLSVSMLAYVLALTHSTVPSQGFYVWDVGQGSSSLLVTEEGGFAFDAPGNSESRFNGGSIAADNIRAMGILELQAVVLSHAQADHGGGLNRLMDSLNNVKEFWLADVPENHQYLKRLDIAQETTVRWLKQGESFVQGNTRVEVLWPPQGYQAVNGNNASLVMLMTLTHGTKLLITGDMEALVERAILNQLGKVDVLLVPHHGSATSSTHPFVEVTSPKAAIAQTGYGNHYQFPKSDVVERYLQVGSKFYNSADSAIFVRFEGEQLSVSSLFEPSYSKRNALSAWMSDTR